MLGNHLSQALLNALKQDTLEICAASGIQVRKVAKPIDNNDYIHCPLSLFPAPVPKPMFEHALRLQPQIGVLLSGILNEPKTNIVDLLSTFAQSDPFLKRLYDICVKVHNSDRKQTLQLNILRSDYMIDVNADRELKLKMVEYNTIASSMGALSCKISAMQDQIIDKYQLETNYQYERMDTFGKQQIGDQRSFIEKKAENFAFAVQQYKKQQNKADESQVWVLFVIDSDERNVMDQKLVEQALFTNHKIHTLRLTFLQISELASTNEHGHLIIDGHEIGIVYYRSGYAHEHYCDEDGGDSEEKWKARELMELSMAIKCPSINLHLAGAKKYQQEFGCCGHLEKFMRDAGTKEISKELESIWKGIHSLEKFDSCEETTALIKVACQKPHDFVLKPQREGGGNNFYDEEVKQILTKIIENPEDAGVIRTYMIMERINPPKIPALTLRNGELTRQECLSEMGIFSATLYDSSQTDKSKSVLRDETIGTLVRTKCSHCNEGGVASGYAVIDSVGLVSSEDYLSGQAIVKF